MITGLRAYYTLLAAQTISLLGSQVSSLAVSIAIYHQTGQATPLTMVSFISAASGILLTGVGGALADRFDRRFIMFAGNLCFILLNALLLVSFASGGFQIWHLYVLSAASALVAGAVRPAFQASIAMLVAGKHRDRANAIAQMTGPAAGVISPMIAGLLYGLIGVKGSIALDIASYIAAIAALSLIRIPAPAATSEGNAMGGSIWKQAFDGFRYLQKRSVLFALFGYVSLVNFLLNPVCVLLLPYLLARSQSTATFGLVMGLINVGAIIGAAAMTAWGGTRPRIHTVIPGIALIGAFMITAGAARTVPWIAASFFMVNFINAFVNAAVMSILHSKVPPDLQGRVFAALGQVTAFLAPAGYLVAGPLTDKVLEPAVKLAAWDHVAWLVGAGPGAGIGLLLFIAGSLTVLLSLIVYGVPYIRQMEATLPNYDQVPFCDPRRAGKGSSQVCIPKNSTKPETPELIEAV